MIDSEQRETVKDWMDRNKHRNKLECNEFDSLYKVLSSMKQNFVHIALIQGYEYPKYERKNSYDDLEEYQGNKTN